MTINKYILICTLASAAISPVCAEDNGPWPIAAEDRVTLTTNQRVYLPVLDNDIGQELVLIDVNFTTVELGQVEMDEAKKGVYYRSANDFVGEDSFWYAIEDNLGRTNSVQVKINVLESPVLIPPVTVDPDLWPAANTDDVTVLKNTAETISVLANDVGESLALTDVNAITKSGGSAVIQGDSIVYNPREDYVGEDSFWYAFADAQGRTNSTKVTITVNEDVEVIPSNVGAFELIAMHDEVLKRRSHISGELDGSLPIRVVRNAEQGDVEINIAGSYSLKDGQLITYKSEDGDYYTDIIISSTNRTLKLSTPLKAPVGRGQNLWNFYHNASHPNDFGYRAIADFALRGQDLTQLSARKHLFLGDSWFAQGAIAERVADKLDNIQVINKGVGGNTAADMLDRFDQDVASQNPDVVWLIAGTNDYYQGVTLSEYKSNMSELIKKINSLGAKAIVIDSSVAPLVSGNQALTDLSHEYAAAIADLLNQ